MRIARRLALGLWVVLAVGAVTAPAVFADTRCSGGPGYDVWQDTNKGGPYARTCGTSSASWRHERLERERRCVLVEDHLLTDRKGAGGA